MPRIYADNAATTKISQTAMKAMISAMENSYGNPSSIHQIGMAANDALQTAREQIARCLGCMPKEIFFTSGGTESDNQAIEIIIHKNQYSKSCGCQHCALLGLDLAAGPSSISS